MSSRALPPVPVRASGLGKSYRGRDALRDATFTLEPGRITLLLGRNGAGKTTLIRRLAGLLRGPGSVVFSGRPLFAHNHPHRILGVDLGTPQMHPGRTVAAHLNLLARCVPSSQDRVQSLAEIVGIAAVLGERPGRLSAGMKRSVAVASALAADPSVLVLDEPINGLEVAAVRRVKGVLRDHAARGGTVLLTSHVLAEMEPIADMVMVLDSGHIVSHEETDRYLGRLPNNVTEVRADDSMRLLTALIERGYAATLGKGGRIRVDGADPPAVARCARDVDVLVVELMAARRTLEDVFFASHSDQSDLLGDAIPRKDEAA